MYFDVSTENIKKKKEAIHTKTFTYYQDQNSLTSVTIPSSILPMQTVFSFCGVGGISQFSAYRIHSLLAIFSLKKRRTRALTEAGQDITALGCP